MGEGLSIFPHQSSQCLAGLSQRSGGFGFESRFRSSGVELSFFSPLFCVGTPNFLTQRCKSPHTSDEQLFLVRLMRHAIEPYRMYAVLLAKSHLGMDSMELTHPVTPNEDGCSLEKRCLLCRKAFDLSTICLDSSSCSTLCGTVCGFQHRDMETAPTHDLTLSGHTFKNPLIILTSFGEVFVRLRVFFFFLRGSKQE